VSVLVSEDCVLRALVGGVSAEEVASLRVDRIINSCVCASYLRVVSLRSGL